MITAIIQARSNSSRLPKKVSMKLGKTTVLDWVVQRTKLAKCVSKVIVATTINDTDDEIVEHCKKEGYDVFRGSEENVLERYFMCALANPGDIILRITADCPLVCPEIIDKVYQTKIENQAEYCSNVLPATFPDGLDVEIFDRDILNKCYENASTKLQKEHVTSWMIENNKIKKSNFKNIIDQSSIRITLDSIDDYEVISRLIDLGELTYSSKLSDIMSSIETNKSVLKINENSTRNEGAEMSNSSKTWIRANGVIPGGNGLFSKRPALFAPVIWPTYFTKTQGLQVYDIEGKIFNDFIMAVGTNTLGYNNREVDTAVKSAIDNGNMSTLNALEEIYLAEKLCDMHHWADMAKFARTGGEANSIAIRIARAATSKNNVAICGYHGWHDWYLAANLPSKNLDEHLMPGLPTDGVNKNLTNTTKTFQYNDIEGFRKVVADNDLACVIMEVRRSQIPKAGFLQEIRKICDRKNIILIFDECTSGFRETFGGLHLKYNIAPDMAMFGKALGNGFAINAVLGKRSIMEFSKTTFISSTNWTERLGFVAGVETLTQMEKLKSWEVISNYGQYYREQLKKLADSLDLKIEFSGLDALTIHTFTGEALGNSDPFELKTLITQEFLEKGYLSSNLFYTSILHGADQIDTYMEVYFEIFKKILKDIKLGKKITNQLTGEASGGGFGRLA